MPHQDTDQPSHLVDDFYKDLREIAGFLLRAERPNHTLQRTALVNEMFVRLFGSRKIRELDRQLFLPIAARQMRQILVDHGRKRRATKRGGDLVRAPLIESDHCLVRDEDSFLALNEALEALGKLDARALAVVELKFFGGMTNKEAALQLGLSDGTIESIWLHARLWLFRSLNTPVHEVSPLDRQRKRLMSMMLELPTST